MMEGKGTENSCSRTRGWLQQDNDAKPWLWKFSNCFSRPEQTLPHSPQTKEYMENKKVAVELKDVPSPLHAGSKLFPAVPLPDIRSLQQPKIQLSSVPKVSCCAHCPNEPSTSPMRFGGGGGSSGGTNSLIHPGALLDSQSTRTITCQVGSGFAFQSASSLQNASARNNLAGIASDFPSMCLESNLSSCKHLPCCGKLHFQSCHGNVHKLHQFPSLQGCTSAGYFPCSDFTSGAPGHLEEHISQSELTPHLCTNSLHLNVVPPVCLKGSLYCEDCLNKPARNSIIDAAKVWPNIPPPNTQPAPLAVSLCNGCGTKGTGKETTLLLATSLGKAASKFGSPEVAVAGQVLENLPPIGVFWDIENCSVPSGRSATAVVQRIREKFFKGHREAEFICVCDISKENKEVIQELNNCQVTVAHINATAKNAADDKLRQSLRRFANTHTAPATVVLVSTDVNFALELSDLRHRHGFHIILVHKNQASEALLHHANELIRFEEFISDLPPRLPLKMPELCRMESKTGHRNSEHQQGHLRLVVPTHGNSSAAVLTLKNSGVAEPVYKTSQKKENLSARSVTSSPVEKKDKEETVFQVSYPSAFSKLVASRQVSPLLASQSWSSRASPLAFNIANSSTEGDCPDPFANGADVQVSNIDYRLSRKELQQLLQEAFARHGKVKSVELSPHTDYQLKAVVQMENLQDAIGAVNSLHRYKIGSKKILVSLATGAASKSLSLLSAETMSVLQDAPACCLPLFKFTDIYEKKFGHKLNVSDLYKLTDTVAIREQGNGRLVCLLPSSQARQSPLGSSQSHDGSSTNCSPIIFEELEYHEPVCRQHCSNKDFSEHEFDPDSYKIPFVILSLKTFAPQVHSLLQTHEGTVPLLSFPDCYTAEFGDLEVVQENQGGVPLEHFITCVPGVNIATAQNGIKVVKWIHNKPPPPNTDPWLLRSKSPVGNPQLIQFSREVIDLLKSQPSCVIPISHFIPSYHHHFAKQCRVSDYGYSKLIELLEAVPHVLQILGMGSKRLLTLTHRAQVKRFTQDLLKLLKSQASKQVIVREFSQAYHWCFSKDWDVTEYGVCELIDIVSEIPDTTICLSQQDNEMVICIPKRERTQDEIERTKQFSKDVVDLLRHQPHFRMPFNKFIPSYHHHFGRQCKLAYYGFTKLLELFEAIPDTLQVLECGEEKILTLTEVERFKALAAQFVKLLRSQKDNCLMMTDLLTEYAKTFGYTFRLQDYDVSSISALTQKLCHVVKVADVESGRQIQLINRKSLRSLTAQLLVLLMSWEGTTHLSVEELKRHYESTHNTPLNPCEYGFMTLTELLKSLPYLVEVFANDKMEECVKLTSLYLFAKNVRSLLHTYHYQQIFLHEFSTAYTKYVGETLQPKTYGHSSVEELLGAIPQVVWIKGHGHKRIVVLKNDMKSRLSSLGLSPANHENQPSEGERILEVPELHTASELKLGADGSEIMILNQEEKMEIPIPGKSKTLTSDSSSSCISAAVPVPPCPSSETSESLLSKDPAESPAKKQPKNRVKLAANFSLAPITKL
ncbi:meiosis regulator and mRNA stability factor 1 isoform X18 [Symphalangus syndactylus]|uniref:meiosis regulator and mRNA stability factor 1 isoform X18 n=1 Tax=Symphalangus syndactylus TaxID=9590 RepID=UPI00300591D4